VVLVVVDVGFGVGRVVGVVDVVVLLETAVDEEVAAVVDVLVLVDDVVVLLDIVVVDVVEVVGGAVVVTGPVVVVVLVEDVVVVGCAVVLVVLAGTMPVQADSSEVSPSGAVAVAVMTLPAAAGGSANIRSASPDPFVMTWTAPRNVAASPFPLGSHAGLAKNSTVNEVLARLLSVPVTDDEVTMDNTG
jgi:hypothetical protein